MPVGPESASALLDRMVQAAVRQRGWTAERARSEALSWLRKEMEIDAEDDPLSSDHLFHAEMILFSHFARSAWRKAHPQKAVRMGHTAERSAPVLSVEQQTFIDDCWAALQEAERRMSPGQKVRIAVDTGELYNVG